MQYTQNEVLVFNSKPYNIPSYGFEQDAVEKMLFCQKFVNNLVKGGLTYLEALTQFCRVYDIGEENINDYLSHSLRTNLYDESVERHLIKPTYANEQHIF